MKRILNLAVATLMVLGASVAQATLFSYDYTSFSQGTNVPDGNPAGWADSRTVSLGLDPHSGPTADGTTTEINDVNVRVNLSGGFNGDLYGYLQLHDENNVTVLTVLLNRVGKGTPGEPTFTFGYSTAGMNVTLDDESGNGSIHAAPAPNLGNYTPDGAGLGLLDGKSANGTWTLFLADMSGGNVSSVVSWGLDINVVPEPVTWALIGFGLVVGLVQAVRWRQQRRLAKG